MNADWEAEELADEVRGVLLNAEAWTGGRLGVMDLGRSAQIVAHLREQGWIGAREGLTRKGAAEARRIQEEEWGS